MVDFVEGKRPGGDYWLCVGFKEVSIDKDFPLAEASMVVTAWRKLCKVCYDLATGFVFKGNDGGCRGCRSERKLSALRAGFGSGKTLPPMDNVAMGGRSMFG